MFRCLAADVPTKSRPAGDDLFVHGQLLRLFALLRAGEPPLLIADVRMYEVARRHAVTQQATIKFPSDKPPAPAVSILLNFPLQQVMWYSKEGGREMVVIA
jgi:hypothetical protein